MEHKQKLMIWIAVSLGILAALFYFVVGPLMERAAQTNSGPATRETPRSIQEQIREELIAPPKNQTPTPTEILKELGAPPPPPSPITSSSNPPRASVTPSPKQVLDSLLGPR